MLRFERRRKAKGSHSPEGIFIFTSDSRTVVTGPDVGEVLPLSRGKQGRHDSSPRTCTATDGQQQLDAALHHTHSHFLNRSADLAVYSAYDVALNQGAFFVSRTIRRDGTNGYLRHAIER